MIFKHFDPLVDPLMVGVQESVMSKLDDAADFSRQIVPACRYIITSGKRNLGGNSVLKGAVADSSHLTGLAVDLLVDGDVAYAAMMLGLAHAGFKRFGLYYVGDPAAPNTYRIRHIHVDLDPAKVSPCIWTKREQN